MITETIKNVTNITRTYEPSDGVSASSTWAHVPEKSPNLSHAPQTCTTGGACRREHQATQGWRLPRAP